MRGIWSVVLFLIFSISKLPAQTVEHEGEFWGAYISSIRVTEKWAVWNDFHWATTSFFVSRHGLTYFFSPNLSASGGYAWVTTATSFSEKLIRDEHRPWGQVVGNFWLSEEVSYQLRFRYDARFRQKIEGQEVLQDRLFYNRLRFMATLRIPVHTINSQTNVQLRIMDEILYNAGGQIDNGIDQNRLYILPTFTYRNLSVLAGYHWRLIPSSGRTLNRHGLSFWVIHNMDFRKRINENWQ
ncbi:DUF2490 domain-containing protein [Litoribacter alkaliphilus]|uniref:DUF2490 domain-containing protein n=1 Tax=Litoribacter ruber TaxID=702568 RepID=A0AAP2CJM2_9BACT|nr:DUF2490 domain-containing protein [Litoribacter alkaliphilus]MBS9525392.1 DUF2490 domain-containing protein [Litoribacter alkaliphilus]